MKRTINSELREVTICHNDVEAQIIKGMLEENRITAYIRKDDCGGMEPQLQITEGIKVLVPSDQFQQAVALVSSFSTTTAPGKEGNRSVWQCKTCNEILEEQFTDCWNCGTARG